MSRYVPCYYQYAEVTSEDGHEEESQDTYHYGSSDDHYNDDDLSPPRRQTFLPQRRQTFLPPTPAQESRSAVVQMKGHGKKRKLMEKGEGAILPEMKRLREELSCHPLYEENAAKVILISNDGQRFNVDAHTLSTFSPVFKTLLTLPISGSSSTEQTGEMEMDVPATVLSSFIHGAFAARHHPVILPEPDLATLDAIVKLHKKFTFTVTQHQADDDLLMALKSDPFAGLGYANRKNDVELGRQAIELIEFDTGSENEYDLWDKVSNVEPLWQLTCMRLALPTYTTQIGGGPVSLRAKCRLGVVDIARQFDPKEKNDGNVNSDVNEGRHGEAEYVHRNSG